MEQLKDIGCKWVILGHSERRHVIGEKDEVSQYIYLKIKIRISEFLLKKMVLICSVNANIVYWEESCVCVE